MQGKEGFKTKILSPEKIIDLSDQEAFIYLEKLLANPQDTQEQLLINIVNDAVQTEFGKRFQFDQIKTVEDFQEKVPISEYCDYKELIDIIAEQGSQDLLFSGETRQFIATSGTTGTPKLFPESQKGSQIKALVSKIRAIKMMMMAKEVMEPGAKVLAIANPAAYGVAKSGIKIGSASGQAASDLPPELLKKMVLPTELLLAKDLSNETIDYLTMFYMLREENLVGVVSSNIAHFELLLEQLEMYIDELTDDIENGKLSHKLEIAIPLRKKLEENLVSDCNRAHSLRQAFAQTEVFPMHEIWPNFSVIACWLSSSTGRVASSFKSRIPEKIKFLEWGYGASEGKFNIPDQLGDPAGPFADFGYFFEFLPPGDTKPKLLHELEENEAYELIITSYSGLYRYNLKDLVWVKEIKNKVPRLQFLSKSSEKMTIDEQDIYVYEVDQSLDAVSRDLNMGVHFYEVMLDRPNAAIHFFIEPLNEDWQTDSYAVALEKTLQASVSAYRDLRQNNVLKPLMVTEMVKGYRNGKIKRAVMPGKNVNQTKLKTIIKENPDTADFHR
ncbi:GH3 auxin-responsive promoter family protein [Eubacteriaceae bacterium ES2]|nr:GH3 auxin-responsive promoter family protein [Eubacteriaceae bacterium ES2]